VTEWKADTQQPKRRILHTE